jgi:hemerythrin-like domain-containing protein
MDEHRLIERMIDLIRKALEQIKSAGNIDPVFVDTAVDFIQTYADRTHHGKEEDILFHALDGKDLSAEDRQLMNQLITEHVYTRKTAKALVEANTRYRNGDTAALSDIAKRLETLVEFYPKHIDKEDKVFFPASRTYFTDEEYQAMLAEFRAFDSKMIHEKYGAVIKKLEG